MITLETGGTLRGKAGTATAITYTIHGDEVSTSDAFKTIAQGQLASSTGTLYTAPASTSTLIKQIHLGNATASQVTGVVFYVNGAVAANQITGTLTIPANGTCVYANGVWTTYNSDGFPIGSVSSIAAANVTYGGGPSIAAINVEDALDELSTEKAEKSITISTTAPITGGGDLSANRTFAMPAATTSVDGYLTALDKKKLDNLWIDVTANSTAIVSAANTGAQNITAINAILSAAPNGSTIYFPPGIYLFNAAWTMPNKMFTFCGRGSNRAGSPATAFTELRWNANVGGTLITLAGSGNGWYTQFRDLVFTAITADQASGGVIDANGNVGVNIINCSFQSSGAFFNDVILYGGGSGSNSGNSTVVENCNIQGFKGTGIRVNSSGSSLVVSNSVVQGLWGTATQAATACISGGFVGALQVIGCDILGAVNNVLLNPVLANSEVCASVFITNTYMDNSLGSCVKVTGTGATVRARFDTCSFTTSSGGTAFSAVELASTFAYTASGQGIDFVNCNILNTFGTTGTTNGFLVSGTADFSIGNCRIAGWTNGIQVTPIATAGRTQPSFNNNTIGPSGGYPGNGTGIVLNAGGAAYGSIVIEGNVLEGNTTAPLTDNAAVNTGNVKSYGQNPGLAGGQVIQATLGAIVTTTTEVVVAVLPLPPGGLRVGQQIRAQVSCKPALTTILTARLRIGTSASVPATDTAVVASADATSVNARYLGVQSQITVVGGSAAHNGNGFSVGGTAGASGNTAASGTFNSAVANFVMLTLTNTSTTTTTVYNGSLEILN